MKMAVCVLNGPYDPTRNERFRDLQYTLCEKCPYLQLFWSVFSRIRTEHGEIRSISPYLIRMRENADQNNSKYGHFLRSNNFQKCVKRYKNSYFLNRLDRQLGPMELEHGYQIRLVFIMKKKKKIPAKKNSMPHFHKVIF